MFHSHQNLHLCTAHTATTAIERGRKKNVELEKYIKFFVTAKLLCFASNMDVRKKHQQKVEAHEKKQKNVKEKYPLNASTSDSNLSVWRLIAYRRRTKLYSEFWGISRVCDERKTCSMEVFLWTRRGLVWWIGGRLALAMAQTGTMEFSYSFHRLRTIILTEPSHSAEKREEKKK